MHASTLLMTRHSVYLLTIGLLGSLVASSPANAQLAGNSYTIYCTQFNFAPPSTVHFQQTVHFDINGTFAVSPSGATGVYHENTYGPAGIFGRFAGGFDAGGSFVGFRLGPLILMQSIPTRRHWYLQVCRGILINDQER